MRATQPWRSTARSALCSCVLLALAPRPGHAAAPRDVPAPHEVLIDEAEQEHEQGHHAAAASLYTRAFGELPAKERTDLMGVIVVRAALADYRAALQGEPEGLAQVDEHLALLREQKSLLSDFVAAKTLDDTPPDIVKALAGVVPRIEALERRKAELEAKEPRPKDGVEPASEDPPPDEHGSSEDGGSNPPASRRRSGDDRATNPRVDVTLLTLGVVSLVGGGALLGSGGWMFGETERRVDAMQQRLDASLAAATAQDRTPEMIALDDRAFDSSTTKIDDFRGQARANATGLVVAGGVLAAAGIGLMTYGIVRMRRSTRGARGRAVVGPVLVRQSVGAWVSVAF